jgi:hypothetical protein
MTEKKKSGVQKGQNLGGVRTLQDIYIRCHVNDETGCWEWRLSCNAGKYPKVTIYDPIKPFTTTGVRASLLLAGHKIGEGQTGYHYKCTNHKCVNPGHLKVGTHAEKWAHIKAQGWMKGDPLRKAINAQIKRNASFMTPHVKDIRASDESAEVWAARIGCCEATIRHIRAYRTHKYEVPNASVFSCRPA